MKCCFCTRGLTMFNGSMECWLTASGTSFSSLRTCLSSFYFHLLIYSSSPKDSQDRRRWRFCSYRWDENENKKTNQTKTRYPLFFAGLSFFWRERLPVCFSLIETLHREKPSHEESVSRFRPICSINLQLERFYWNVFTETKFLFRESWPSYTKLWWFWRWLDSPCG